MHPALQAFFDKHESGTAAHRRAVNDSLEPISAAIAEAIRHVLDLELSLEKAERAIADPAFTSKLEWIHTRTRSVRSELEGLKTQARSAVKKMAELDAIFTRDKQNIEFLSGDATTASVGDSAVTTVSVHQASDDPTTQKLNKLAQRAIDATRTTA